MKKISAILMLVLISALMPVRAAENAVRIEAEDYVNYYDLTEGVDPMDFYIKDRGDDVECAYGATGIVVGMNDTEWLEYTVNVQKSGYYSFRLSTATDAQMVLTSFKVSAGGAEVNHVIHSRGWGEYDENTCLLPLSAGENTVRVTVSGAMNFDFFEMEYVSELDAALEAEICGAMKNAFGCYERYGKYLGIDIYSDMEKIFSKDNVFYRLSGGYKDIVSIQNEFARVYAMKIAEPDTYAECGAERITEISGGLFTVFESIEDVSDGVLAVGAVYENGRLIGASFGEVSGGSCTLSFNLGSTDSKKSVYKLFLLDNASQLTPYIRGGRKIYMAPDGSDENSGEKNMPVKTLSRAVKAAEKLSESTKLDVVIEIADGEYSFTEPVTVTAEDNHKNGGKIILRGGADTVFNGGVKVDGWENYNGKIYRAPLNLGEIRQLYVNGTRAERAKSKVLSGSGIYSQSGENDGINYRGTLAKGLENEKNAELVWDLYWTRQRVPVEKIIKNNILSYSFKMRKPYYSYLLEKEYTGTAPINGTESFYIENAFAYLDEPGEFYFDEDQKMLYYYPHTNESLDNCYVGVSEGFIRFEGTDERHVRGFTVENIKMRYGTYLEPNEKGLATVQGDKIVNSAGEPTISGGRRMHSQIALSYADDILLENNTIEHIGSCAIDFFEGVKNCYAVSNYIADTSAGAFMAGSWNHDYSSNQENMCGYIGFSNNEVTDIASEYAGSPAVSLYYVNNAEVSHNTITNTAYSGISVGWGWSTDTGECRNNKITDNRIENVLTVLNDGANIYTLGSLHGTVISGNYLSKSNDISGGSRGGIYLDEGSGYVTVSGNVVEECKRWLFARAGVNLKEIRVFGNYSDTEEYVADTESGGVIMGKNYSYTTRTDEAKKIIENSGIVK